MRPWARHGNFLHRSTSIERRALLLWRSLMPGLEVWSTKRCLKLRTCRSVLCKRVLMSSWRLTSFEERINRVDRYGSIFQRCRILVHHTAFHTSRFLPIARRSHGLFPIHAYRVHLSNRLESANCPPMISVWAFFFSSLLASAHREPTARGTGRCCWVVVVQLGLDSSCYWKHCFSLPLEFFFAWNPTVTTIAVIIRISKLPHSSFWNKSFRYSSSLAARDWRFIPFYKDIFSRNGWISCRILR